MRAECLAFGNIARPTALPRHRTASIRSYSRSSPSSVDIRTLKHHVKSGDLPAVAIKTKNGRTVFRIEREKAREWWASRGSDAIQQDVKRRKQRIEELRARRRTASAAQREGPRS